MRAQALSAALQVGRPIGFATLIVVAVFLPLFGVGGIEGRMYQPLGAAVIAAMGASLVLALSLTPVVAAHVLRSQPGAVDHDVWVVRHLKAVYAPLLDWCLRNAGLVRLASLGVTVPVIVLAFYVGSDFMPKLDEGAFLLQSMLPPEASLAEVDRLNHRLEDVLREFPEVEDVVRRTGRAERTEDPMPHTVSDVLVVLKSDRSRSLEELESAMRARAERVPGISVLFTTPLGMRIDEGLGGTPADIAVRIFGPDLDELARLGERARRIVGEVDGIADECDSSRWHTAKPMASSLPITPGGATYIQAAIPASTASTTDQRVSLCKRELVAACISICIIWALEGMRKNISAWFYGWLCAGLALSRLRSLAGS